MGEYILGSCIEHLGRECDYVFTSPPCLEDASFWGVDVRNPETYKTKFLDQVFPLLNPRLGTVTVSFTGSRRNNARIINKSHYLTQTMYENGYYLRDRKYVLKSTSFNAYDHQTIEVLTYQKEKVKGLYNLKKNGTYHTYGKDVWGPFSKQIKLDGEVLGQPIEIAEYCIMNFTDEGHLVYDPFSGIGTTLKAAKKHGRDYWGYEIRKKIHDVGQGIVNQMDIGEFL